VGALLLFINAVAERPTTATAEVRTPPELIELGEVDDAFAVSLVDEAASFDSDRITSSIDAVYRGSLDPGRATARPKPGTDSVVVIEVEGSPPGEVRDLVEVAAASFAEVRRSEQLDVLSARIEVLSQRSDELREEIEQLVALDFAARADPASSDDPTAIAALVEPLAEEYAELYGRVTGYEAAATAISADGYDFTAAPDLAAELPLVSTSTLIATVVASMLVGAGVAFALGRREHGAESPTSIMTSNEVESDPLAWVNALTAEPDGVFIDVDYAAPAPGSAFAALEEIDLRSEPATEALTTMAAAADQFFSSSPANGSN
jgi:hypothetical protein